MPFHTSTATDLAPRHWAERADKAIPQIAVPRLAAVRGDLMQGLRPVAIFLIARPVLGVAAFVAMAMTGWWIATPVVLWFTYGSTATALHHLIHGSVGLSTRARHFWLTVLGLVILESGHAWQATHVMHHRDGTDLPDPEGYIEYLSWSQLPVGALKWRFRIAAWGWRHGQRRQRTTFEIAVNITATMLAIALTPVTIVPLIYVVLMQLGTFLFAVLLAKGPQANFGRETTTPLMLVRGRLTGLLLFNHHLHVEHHAYPKVPIARLRHLSPTVEHALADRDVLRIHLPV